MAANTDKTRKMLWGRSGGVCAICKKQLFEDESESDAPSVLGQECHIVGEENAAKSPRGLNALPLENRNLFDNLMLLCRDHHKVIDDQSEKYSIEELHRIKNDHLKWVRKNLGFDELKQADEEIYASFVDKFTQLSVFNEWEGFTYCVLAGDAPFITRAKWEALEELHDWLFNRVYPERFPAMRCGFENFRLVLHDFRKVFSRHSEIDSSYSNCIQTCKFYRIDHYDEQLYERLSREYKEHVGLLSDLVLELTRAGNYLADKIRQHLIRSFRMKEGLLIARTGIWADGADRALRVSYRDDERTNTPYHGLDTFMSMRCQRDFSFANDQ